MTAKEFVKIHYPKAASESHTTNGNEKYYLIRPARHEMYLATGKTESSAWTNAKKEIERRIEVAQDK